MVEDSNVVTGPLVLVEGALTSVIDVKGVVVVVQAVLQSTNNRL